LEDFNLDHLPSLRRDVLAQLATGTFIPKADNVILLGPSVIGKAHLAIGAAIGLGVKPPRLFFQLIASRYEQASVLVTGNLPFGRRGSSLSGLCPSVAGRERPLR